MKTLEEVKEHFKNAKEVKSTLGSVFNMDDMDIDSIHKYGGDIYIQNYEGGRDYCLQGCCGSLAEIISYKDEYPKVMLVWDYNEDRAGKRVVISKFNNFYICLGGIDRLEDLDRAKVSLSYKYAKDLPTIKEVTMSEVAAAMGIEESLLRIKK
tara:strand:+ start:225 stop:683 length:459 start_codon:yes stop_codon:yes gene_type:complete